MPCARLRGSVRPKATADRTAAGRNLAPCERRGDGREPPPPGARGNGYLKRTRSPAPTWNPPTSVFALCPPPSNVTEAWA